MSYVIICKRGGGGGGGGQANICLTVRESGAI